jgi:hypothetical protein
MLTASASHEVISHSWALLGTIQILLWTFYPHKKTDLSEAPNKPFIPFGRFFPLLEMAKV